MISIASNHHRPRRQRDRGSKRGAPSGRGGANVDAPSKASKDASSLSHQAHAKTFSLGQAALPSEMAVPSTPEDALRQAASLQVGEGAWVKRSSVGAMWTFAVLKERVDGPEGHLLFHVDPRGSTKKLHVHHWVRCVRRVADGLKTAHMPRQQRGGVPSSSRDAKCEVTMNLPIFGKQGSGGSDKVILSDHEVSMYTLCCAKDAAAIRVLRDIELPVCAHPAAAVEQMPSMPTQGKSSNRSKSLSVKAWARCDEIKEEDESAMDGPATEQQRSSKAARHHSLMPKNKMHASVRPRANRQVSWRPELEFSTDDDADINSPQRKKAVGPRRSSAIRSRSVALPPADPAPTEPHPPTPAERRPACSRTEEQKSNNESPTKKRRPSSSKSPRRSQALRSASVALPQASAFCSRQCRSGSMRIRGRERMASIHRGMLEQRAMQLVM